MSNNHLKIKIKEKQYKAIRLNSYGPQDGNGH